LTVGAGAGVLYGLAYLLLAVALLPIAANLWRKTQTGMASRETTLFRV